MYNLVNNLDTEVVIVLYIVLLKRANGIKHHFRQYTRAS
jgi:hypothetical protein